MTLRHMRIFVAVCESESATLAAKGLFLTQPAVSLAISELETYYGIKLFDRISKRLHLTEHGIQFLIYAKQIILLFDEMDRRFKNADSCGLIRVGSSITIGTCLLSQYVRQFTQVYPDVKVNVTIDNSEIIEKRILANELDFGLIEGIAHSEHIISQSFLDDELVVVCAPGNPLVKQSEITINELTSQPFILREKGSGTRELFDSTLLTFGQSVTPIWESISTAAIVNAVTNSIGISVLPQKLVLESIISGKIRSIKIKNVDFKRKFNIIYHKDKYISKIMNSFFEICLNTAN